MKLQTIFLLFILLCIIAVAFQTVIFHQGDKLTEGFNASEWDIEYINQINNTHNFEVKDGMREFIEYLMSMGYEYYSYKANSGRLSEFQPYGKGVCMQDWEQRTIRLSQSDRRQNCPNVKSCQGFGNIHTTTGSSAPNPKLYNICKARATEAGATVFGLQYGKYCLYGNTNKLALGLEPDSLNRNAVASPASCNRMGFPAGNGSSWTQMVYTRELQQSSLYRFYDYENIVKEWKQANYNSDQDLKIARPANTFTTMTEGFQEGNDDINSVPPDEIVTLPDAVDIFNKYGKKVASLDEEKISVAQMSNYTFTENEKLSLFKKQNEYGLYFPFVMSIFFNIKSEKVYNLFVTKMKELNAHPNAFANPIWLVILLRYYCGIESVDAIIKTNGAATNEPWLTNIILKYQLHKLSIPVFMSSSIASDDLENNVLAKFISIGVYPTKINEFCQTFSEKDTNMTSFFNTIYPTLIKPRVDGGVFQYWYTTQNSLREILNVVGQINKKNLPNAFEQFTEVLSSMNLTSYESYTTFVSNLQKVGVSLNFKEILGLFKAYYPNVAYLGDENKIQAANASIAKSPLTANSIFTNFVDLIPGYFLTCNANFNEYLKLITDNKYSIPSIMRDRDIGGTYCKYMSINKPISGFSTLSGADVQPSVIDALNDAFKSFKQMLGYSMEGMETGRTTPDNRILNKFGITDHTTQLGELENMLLGKYGFNNWSDIMQFVDPLSTLIQFDKLKNYITIMLNLGATTKTAWSEVTTELSLLQIKDFPNIEAFLTTVSSIGVVNYSNFLEFIKKLDAKNFNANFTESPPVLPGSAIRVFCNDMKIIGFRYDNNTKQNIHNLINYFVVLGFNLQTYSSSLPHSLVDSMRSYDSSSPHRHNFFDLTQDPPLSKLFSKETGNEMMSQGYYIASEKMDDSILNNEAAKTILASFLYTTEYNELQKDNSNVYSDVKIRITLMNNIAAAMNLMAIGYNPQNQDNKSAFKLYTNLTNLTRMFPMLMFQYLHRLIISKCRNGNCTFSVNNPTDVNYVHSSSKYRTINTIP